MTDKPYIVLDFETSGLNFAGVNRADGHWPVSLAMKRMENGKETARYYEFFKPTEECDRNWSASAEKIHGISKAMLESGEVQGKGVVDFLNEPAEQQKLIQFLGLDVPLEQRPDLLTQNAPVEVAFLNRMLKEIEHPLIGYQNIYCSKAIASTVLPKGESTHLNDMAKTYLGRGQMEQHDALDDCELASGMFEHFKQHHPEKVKLLTEIYEELLSSIGMKIDGIETDRMTITWPRDVRFQYPALKQFLETPPERDGPLIVAQEGDQVTLHLNNFNRVLNKVVELAAWQPSVGRSVG